MSDYESSTEVAAAPDALFDYLSEVRNLPQYFQSMTSAEPGEGETVRTTAIVDGTEVQGEAWFRVDRDANTLAWGAEGPNDYRGELDVTDAGSGASRVTVRLHTENRDGPEVQRGLDKTVATIRRLVEESTGHS